MKDREDRRWEMKLRGADPWGWSGHVRAKATPARHHPLDRL